mmetsp:Transcript_96765/g.167980  ORF Transcript_96765/g.167980 Transcript_96765/m.167980 type:complete len:372 (+) Transcript_96765:150-1265(+)
MLALLSHRGDVRSAAAVEGGTCRFGGVDGNVSPPAGPTQPSRPRSSSTCACLTAGSLRLGEQQPFTHFEGLTSGSSMEKLCCSAEPTHAEPPSVEPPSGVLPPAAFALPATSPPSAAVMPPRSLALLGLMPVHRACKLGIFSSGGGLSFDGERGPGNVRMKLMAGAPTGCAEGCAALSCCWPSNSVRRALRRPMCSAALWSSASKRALTPSHTEPSSRTSAANDERKAPSSCPISAVAAAVAAATAPSIDARSSATSSFSMQSRSAETRASNCSSAGLKPTPPLCSSSQRRLPPSSSHLSCSSALLASARQRARTFASSATTASIPPLPPGLPTARGEVTAPAAASAADAGTRIAPAPASSCSTRSLRAAS